MPISALRETAKSVIVIDGDGNAVEFTSANPLPVSIESSIGTGQTGTQSTVNSTTTPLGANETFTGTGEENGFPDIGCYCVSDQDGSLIFEFQDANGTWRAFPPSGFSVTANIPEFHTAVKLPRPTRIKFTNGATPQSSLAIQTYWGTFRQGNAPLNLSIAADADAIVVRALDPSIDLALGKIGGQAEDAKFGNVKFIDAADNVVDIWRVADDNRANRVDRKTFPTVATTCFIASSSATDTDVDVEITYLDSDGNTQTVSVNTNGQSGITTGVSMLDSNRMKVTGDNQNVGDIYLTTENNFSAGGIPNDFTKLLAMIPATKGQTQQAIDTTPAGKKYRIKHLFIYISRASGSAGSAAIELQVRENGGSWRTIRDFEITNSAPVNRDEVGLVFDPLTNIRLSVMDVSDTDTSAVGIWDYDLIDT